ncbi:helix-turn-helix transcriptional regulator [Sinorhizobium americanum]|uniref:Helix-turn-helix domain-containing protein n=1 Tax=Sinorhizobium americanum TaxID=194963 RepID=A0A4R2BS33_9HYPH|nr:hypothetical protein [Sinorhizobium americanum]TCN30286.1 hypothetical protein EV184_108160 [Sinorhizobium americanum]
MTAAVRTVPRIGLNRDEVALALGVSVNTVDQMVEEGYLPKPKRWHTRKVWQVSAIEAALSEWPEDGAGRRGQDAGGDDDWVAS